MLHRRMSRFSGWKVVLFAFIKLNNYFPGIFALLFLIHNIIIKYCLMEEPDSLLFVVAFLHRSLLRNHWMLILLSTCHSSATTLCHLL